MTDLKLFETVDLFQIRFPRISQDVAIQLLLDKLQKNETVGVCFADMSTLNLVYEKPSFKQILQSRMLTLNDGAGLEWLAKWRGKPFPANLNGTDLCPRFLAELPTGTTVYLIGGKPGVALRCREFFSERFKQIKFVGDHHGFLDPANEQKVVEDLRRLTPNVVLVAMGNPLQVEFINRHLDDPQLQGIMWWAVGGLLDFYGSDRIRAPSWMRVCRLEWLHIIYTQPYKWRRYLFGIPLFIFRSLKLCLLNQQDRNS